MYTVEYYSAIKKNEIMPSAATWVDLDVITLSEVGQTKKNIIWYHLPWNLKKWHKWTYLLNRKWHTDIEIKLLVQFSSVQSSSVSQLCPTLCDPMNRTTPGLPVHHQLPEFTQTHVHQVGDAIQPSHPLLSPSPPAPNLSQNQGLFQWVNSSHEVAKVLEFQL